MTPTEHIFDEHLLKNFNEGDMVTWLEGNDLHEVCGLIVTLGTQSVRGDATRKFASAKIETEEGPIVVISLGLLKLVSKVHRHRKKLGCDPY